MHRIKTGILAALSLTAVFCSCSKKDTTPSNQANVDFMNACLNSTTLDATNSGANISGATGLDFLKFSNYQGVTPGSLRLGFYFDATHTVVKDTNLTLLASSNYSVFLAGLITSPSIVITSDDVLAPASAMAKIRFINLSTDTNSMDAYIGTIKLASGTNFKSVGPFLQLTGGSLKILVQNPNNPPDQVVVSNYAFSNGRIYTVVLTGTQTGTGVAALTLTVLNNN